MVIEQKIKVLKVRAEEHGILKEFCKDKRIFMRDAIATAIRDYVKNYNNYKLVFSDSGAVDLPQEVVLL